MVLSHLGEPSFQCHFAEHTMQYSPPSKPFYFCILHMGITVWSILVVAVSCFLLHTCPMPRKHRSERFSLCPMLSKHVSRRFCICPTTFSGRTHSSLLSRSKRQSAENSTDICSNVVATRGFPQRKQRGKWKCERALKFTFFTQTVNSSLHS